MHSHNMPVKLDGYQQSTDPAYFIEGYTTSGSVTSAPLKIARKTGYSLTISCPATGSPNGEVKLQGSNDEERVLDVADANVTNWFDINDLTSPLVGDSVICFEDPDPQYRWVRVVYTRTSGSITITCRLHSKDYSA